MKQYKPEIDPCQVDAIWQARLSLQDIMSQIAEDKILVLGGFCANLTTRSIDGKKCLLYTNGEERVIFVPGKHNLKKIVWQTTSRLPRESAIKWMEQEKVAFSIIDGEGDIIAESDHKVLRKRELVQKQMNLMSSQKLEYACDLIKRKISGQIATLTQFSGLMRNGLEVASQMENELPQIHLAANCSSERQIMLFEGRAASAYFQAWRSIQVPWAKGQNSLKEYAAYPGRSEGANGNRTALDPINAMLNFAYFTLENRILHAIQLAGIDGQESFLHAPEDSQNNLIYDFIEPLRPRVDGAILKFLKSFQLEREFFDKEKGKQGLWRLSYDFARVVTALIEREISDKDIQDVIADYVAYLTGEKVVQSMPTAIGRKIDLPSYKSNRVVRGPSKKTLAMRAIKDKEFEQQIQDRLARDSA